MCSPAQIHEAKTIRCVLAQDHLLLRQGLRRLLEDQPDIRVVAEAGNAAEALQRVFEHRPEVVIADLHIFECPANESERLILGQSPESRVLFLTTQEGDEPTNGSVAVRQTSAEELVQMVRKTAAAKAGESAVAEWPAGAALPKNRALTSREREVLKLLAEGRTVRSVANILGLSVKTVEAHKFNLMRKLGIHNKAALVMWAIQMKIVKVPMNL